MVESIIINKINNGRINNGRINNGRINNGRIRFWNTFKKLKYLIIIYEL